MLVLFIFVVGNIAIVTSDGEGHISAFNPYSDLWRIRLTDIRQLKGLGLTPYIRSLLTIDLVNSQGQNTNYTLAADNCRHLYFLHQGAIVKFVTTPAPISAVCIFSLKKKNYSPSHRLPSW